MCVCLLQLLLYDGSSTNPHCTLRTTAGKRGVDKQATVTEMDKEEPEDELDMAGLLDQWCLRERYSHGFMSYHPQLIAVW